MSHNDKLIVYLNNDNVVHIRGLRFYDEEYANGALVTFRIFDSDNNIIFDKEMDYVSDSHGEYKVIIPHDTELNMARHDAEIEVQSQTRYGFWEGVLAVKKRGFYD